MHDRRCRTRDKMQEPPMQGTGRRAPSSVPQRHGLFPARPVPCSACSLLGLFPAQAEHPGLSRRDRGSAAARDRGSAAAGVATVPQRVCPAESLSRRESVPQRQGERGRRGSAAAGVPSRKRQRERGRRSPVRKDWRAERGRGRDRGSAAAAAGRDRGSAPEETEEEGERGAPSSVPQRQGERGRRSAPPVSAGQTWVPVPRGRPRKPGKTITLALRTTEAGAVAARLHLGWV